MATTSKTTKAKASDPPVGEVWAEQTKAPTSPDGDEAVLDADGFDPATGDAEDDLLPGLEGALEASYERTGDEDEKQSVVDFPKISVMAQLQNVSIRPRSNGVGIFFQFEVLGDTVSPSDLAHVEGADLVFDKVLLAQGATFNGGSFKKDADGNTHLRVTFLLPQSELSKPDPRPFVTKTGVLSLEPAQLSFDLTKRAE